MLTGSIPPTGMPMPFVSAGGTSLSVFMGAMGILCNVSKMSGNSENFELNNHLVWILKSNKKRNNKYFGLVFRDFNKKDLKSGDMSTFKKEN